MLAMAYLSSVLRVHVSTPLVTSVSSATWEERQFGYEGDLGLLPSRLLNSNTCDWLSIRPYDEFIGRAQPDHHASSTYARNSRVFGSLRGT